MISREWVRSLGAAATAALPRDDKADGEGISESGTAGSWELATPSSSPPARGELGAESWKMEVGSWRLGAGSWELGDGNYG
jgi:hypothetical protein